MRSAAPLLSPALIRRLRILAFRWRRAGAACTVLALIGLLALNALLLTAPAPPRESRPAAQTESWAADSLGDLREGEHALAVRLPSHEALPLAPGRRVRISPADPRVRWTGRVLSVPRVPPGSARASERESSVVLAVPEDAAAEAAAAARQGRLIVTAVR